MGDAGVPAEMARERRTIVQDEVARTCGPDKKPVEGCPARMDFSVGWYIYGYDDHTLFAHTGANNGEKTLALYSPDLQMGLTVFQTATMEMR